MTRELVSRESLGWSTGGQTRASRSPCGKAKLMHERAGRAVPTCKGRLPNSPPSLPRHRASKRMRSLSKNKRLVRNVPDPEEGKTNCSSTEYSGGESHA